MLDYVISLKPLFFATIVGVSGGYFSSCLIDNFLLSEYIQTVDSSYKRIVNMISWYIAIVLLFSIIFIGFAAVDYQLSFVPSYSLFSNIRFVANETILSSFMFAFLCGISSTLIRIGEMAFATYKKNKT